MKLSDYLKEAQSLEENTPQNRKKAALKLFKSLGKIESSQIEQHHKNGKREENESLNLIYLFSKDGRGQKDAHRYIHAKAYVDKYEPKNLYELIPDYKNNTAHSKKLTKNDLDLIAKDLIFQKSTEIAPEDYNKTIE